MKPLYYKAQSPKSVVDSSCLTFALMMLFTASPLLLHLPLFPASSLLSSLPSFPLHLSVHRLNFFFYIVFAFFLANIL